MERHGTRKCMRTKMLLHRLEVIKIKYSPIKISNECVPLLRRLKEIVVAFFITLL